MSETQGFQDRGEQIREALGIDGTAADAQDVPHPYTPDMGLNPGVCGACGTGLFAPVHEDTP